MERRPLSYGAMMHQGLMSPVQALSVLPLTEN